MIIKEKIKKAIISEYNSFRENLYAGKLLNKEPNYLFLAKLYDYRI